MTEDTKPSWMPDRPYDYTSVMERLNVIISAKPDDYVYPKLPRLMGDGTVQAACSYWHHNKPGAVDEAADPGEPGCIVGQLLHSYGVPRQMLIDCDNAGPMSTSWNSIRDRFRGMFTDETSAMLQFIQTQQDDGTPWSKLPALVQAWGQGWLYAQNAASGKLRDLSA